MKYSVNYYSKKKRDFKESHIQVPKIFETITINESIKATGGDATNQMKRHDFVVPWQLP